MIKPIAIVGFYGNKKSVVAQLVAAQTNMPFSDLYSEIEKLSGTRINSLYEKMGGLVFGKFESLALSSLAASGGVVAASGGCVDVPYNRRVFKESFFTVYLDAPFEYIYPNIARVRRPTIAGLSRDELKTLYGKRRPIYEEISDCTIDATLPVSEIKDKVIELALTEV